MKINYLYEGLLFVLLVLLQVLLLSRIALFGIVPPVVYIYFLLKLPIGRSPFYVIIFGFLLGFVIDIFFNTPGMNAAATTIVAAFRRPIMSLFYERVEHDEFVPSIYNKAGAFVRFTVFTVALHLTLLFFIESFTLFNFLNTLLRVVTSTIVSVALILGMDSLTYKKKSGDQT
ncbi:MAG: rod shape-determining protein MreD [Fermentimonas sp.]|jgi:rod shape-determining protein MreD